MKARGFAMIDMALGLLVLAVILSIAWRALAYSRTTTQIEETSAFLQSLQRAAADARLSTAPVNAIRDSQLIANKYRVGTTLVAPTGGTTTVAVAGAGTLPQLTVTLAPPYDAAACSELPRRQLSLWQEVRIGSTIVGVLAYGSSTPIATDAQIETACNAKGALAFVGAL
jgi:Tfp pilus assembly protein PilE